MPIVDSVVWTGVFGLFSFKLLNKALMRVFFANSKQVTRPQYIGRYNSLRQEYSKLEKENKPLRIRKDPRSSLLYGLTYSPTPVFYDQLLENKNSKTFHIPCRSQLNYTNLVLPHQSVRALLPGLEGQRRSDLIRVLADVAATRGRLGVTVSRHEVVVSCDASERGQMVPLAELDEDSPQRVLVNMIEDELDVDLSNTNFVRDSLQSDNETLNSIIEDILESKLGSQKAKMFERHNLLVQVQHQ